MGSLVEVLKDNAKRQLVLNDCEQLLDDEVSDKKGFSGTGVKVVFKAVKTLKQGMIRHTLDDLVDELAAKVDPFWLKCQEEGADPARYFTSNKVAIANEFLSITDGRAKASKHSTIVKSYQQLRPKAVEYIGDAMPRFGRLVAKHAS